MLIDVYDFVVRDFRASGCGAKVWFGAEFLAQHDDANRVVFVPTTDSRFEAPVPSVHPQGSVANGQFARSILTRICGCEIHIWGGSGRIDLGEGQLRADYSALNALINQTVLSLYRAAGLGGVGRFLGGSHKPGPITERRGFVYVLNYQLAIPIVDIDYPCGPIDECVKTWLTESGVAANITVNELTPAVPTGTLMSSMNFQVSGA